MMQPLKNEFSWSLSRNKSFLECRRKFYYSYYGSWGGWEPDATKETREIYILNKLKNRYMWAGEVVHGIIENLLKKYHWEGVLLEAEKTILQAKERLKSEFSSSENKNYRINPKTTALYEHEYEVELPPDKWQKLYDDVEVCLRNFFLSSFYKNLPELKEYKWLPIEKFEYFTLGGYKISVKLDFAYFNKDELTIIDWKTGRLDHQDTNQLACYGLYAREKLEVPPEKVNTIEYNLFNQTAKKSMLSKKILEDVENFILSSIYDIKGCIDDVENNTARIESFPKTSDSAVCRSCNFVKVCR